MASFDIDHGAAAVLTELFEAQAQWSEVPDASGILVEESPSPDGDGLIYTFHAPLHRAACEALGRATSARLGRRFGRNLGLSVADLGWSIRIDGDVAADGLDPAAIGPLLDLDGFAADVLEGLDRGELPARRFQQIAATGLMVLRNSEPGRRVRVGGMNWVSTRLYPLVKAACPDHPLLRETRARGARGPSRRPGRPAMARTSGRRFDSGRCRANLRSPPPGSSRARSIPFNSSPPPMPCGGCTLGWFCKPRRRRYDVSKSRTYASQRGLAPARSHNQRYCALPL